MTLAEAVAAKLSRLPEDAQRRVLRFIDSLDPAPAARTPLHDPEGLLS